MSRIEPDHDLVRALSAWAGARGIDPTLLGLQQTGRRADDGASAWLEAAAILARDPSLGLSLPSVLPFDRYAPAEIVARSQRDIATVLTAFAHDASAWLSSIRAETITTESEFELTFDAPGVPRGLGRVANEYVLASALSLARIASGVDLACRRVWFSHSRPREIARAAQYFGTGALVFGAPSSGFSLAVDDSTLPSRYADDRMIATLAPIAARAREERVARVGFAAHVASAIEASLPATEMEVIARRLRVGTRTLQRRLAAEGMTYSDVLDGVRTRLAQRYLADPARTLADISESLSFADIASFGRAFKRWTGESPGAYRAAISSAES